MILFNFMIWRRFFGLITSTGNREYRGGRLCTDGARSKVQPRVLSFEIFPSQNAGFFDSGPAPCCAKKMQNLISGFRSVVGFLMLVLSMSGPANATTVASSVTGASAYELGNGKEIKIYAGVVYGHACDTETGDPCNSCDGVCPGAATICACNPKTVAPGMTLNMILTTSIDMTGRTLRVRTAANADITGTSAFNTSGLYNVSIPWTSLCDLAGSGTNCQTTGSYAFSITPSTVGSSTTYEEAEKVSVTVVISAVDQSVASTYTSCPDGNAAVANAGICYYTIFRGDEKVYIENTRTNNFPQAANGLKYNSLVFFHNRGVGSVATITNSTAGQPYYKSVESDSFDDTITGLENDENYCFLLGHQDSTGNITNFENPAGGRDAEVCATPTLVEGLLDDKKCFIATAAFGSDLDSFVTLLRQFRARFLAPSSLGQKFIKFYYKHSPTLAKKIKQNENLRSMVQVALWPVVGFAALSMKVGMGPAFLLVLLAVMFFSGVFYFRKRAKLRQRLGKWIFIFLIVSAFVGVSPQLSYAQDVDDREEGGPPQEPPFIDDPELEGEIMGEFEEAIEENKPEKAKTETSEKETPVVSQEPEIIAAPKIEAKAFKVPLKPKTEEGQRTGSELIHHPEAAKGLLVIDKEGNYHYKADRPEFQNIGVSFRVGQVNPPPDIIGSNTDITYKSMYGEEYPMQLMIDYEWYPFSGFGRLGLQGGLGFFSDKGSGRFVDDGTEAREKYDFYGLPLYAGGIYRLQLGSRPWLAPYLAGGGAYYLLLEKRDDGASPNYAGAPAFYGGGGMLFSISAFDRDTSYILESEYGLQNLWVMADFRYVQSTNEDIDISASIVSLGLMMDY